MRKIFYKKGEGAFFRDNAFGIILAVMAILVLGLLAYKSYNFFVVSNASRQAESNLENIIEIVDSLEDGQEVQYLLLSPRGWALTGWPYKEQMPYQCTAENLDICLCICEETFTGTSGSVVDSCNSNGVCKGINAEYNEFIVNSLLGSSTPISVNKLLEDGDAVYLKKEGNKLLVEVR